MGWKGGEAGAILLLYLIIINESNLNYSRVENATDERRRRMKLYSFYELFR